MPTVLDLETCGDIVGAGAPTRTHGNLETDDPAWLDAGRTMSPADRDRMFGISSSHIRHAENPDSRNLLDANRIHRAFDRSLCCVFTTSAGKLMMVVCNSALMKWVSGVGSVTIPPDLRSSNPAGWFDYAGATTRLTDEACRALCWPARKNDDGIKKVQPFLRLFLTIVRLAEV